jgi:uncharacterized membrane protein YeaQ/YmgE (transglycosylase-associated protein family)
MLRVLLAIPNYTFIPKGGFMDTLMHKSFIEFAIAGFPNPPFLLTLIGLIILTIIAIAVNGITEKLTGKKVGGVMAAIIFTVIGSALAVAFVKLPFDFELEGVRIIAALIGATVISVFYSLFRAQFSKSGGH